LKDLLYHKGNQKARRLANSSHVKGGEAMSAFEIIMVVFGAITIVIALIGLMLYIADIFSKRK